MVKMNWRCAQFYGRRTLDHRFENEMPDAAERWLRRAERRLQQQRITVIKGGRVIEDSRRRRLTFDKAREGGRRRITLQ